MRVLGIDPGSETTGWGVIEGDGTGWAMQVPAIVGLALCDAVVLYAVSAVRRRAGARRAASRPLGA